MHRSGAHPALLPSAAVAICGAIWGCYWYPLRWLEAAGLGGAWVSVIFFATTALSPIPWMFKRAAWQGFRQHFAGGALLGLAFTLYTVSLLLTDVIDAILLFYLTPVWSTLAGLALFGERLTPQRLIAIALGFAGMAFILGFDNGLPMPSRSGDWLALVSGMIWAAGTMRSARKPSSSIMLPVLSFSGGGLIASLGVAIIAMRADSSLATFSNPEAVMPWAIIIALLVFVPPNFLVLWAAQRLDSGRVGILLMTEVLAGAITAALLSGEAFGAMEITGTLLIAGAGLIEVFGRR